MLRIRLFGGIAVEVDGRSVPPSVLAARQGRLVLAYLVCARRAVAREELAELLWPEELPESWPASLSAVVSRLRRLFSAAGLDGQRMLISSAGGYQLVLPDDTWVDWHVAHEAVQRAEHVLESGQAEEAVAVADEVVAIVDRGFLTDDCEWVDRQREIAHDLAVRAVVAKAAAHLAAGSTRRAVEEARDALRRDPLREATFRLLMRALAAAGERAEALRVWEHCRTTLVEELGVDPSPETEAVYLEVLGGTPPPPDPPPPVAPVTTALPSGVVTFLLTDIVESSTLWERHPAAMAVALERHDALVAEIVERHGGTVLKSKLEGDATVSVFARATAGASAALALLDALENEEWPAEAAPRVRMALHTGEAFERGGDYFGPALNRAARLRSLAGGGQVLLSQAVAELVADHLPEGIALADRGHRDLRGLSRGENVYELIAAGADPVASTVPAPLLRPAVPTALAVTGPFVGRREELSRLMEEWAQAAAGSPRALLLAGEPGVGKSRLAAESARAAHDAGGLVLYGRCDEDLGAPLQPFNDAIRPLVPALGAARLRQVQGIDELSRVIPELGTLLPETAAGTRADPDTERRALFDAITRLLATASEEAPVLLVLDDLHWAGKTTLTLVRHLLRNAESARLLVLGTYRDTELARTHPLAATLADLNRDGTAERLTLGGLDVAEVTAYLEAVGRPDRALGRELARVTSGNAFFVIETLRHVEETGGTWEQGGLPQGVREATGRRLSRLSEGANGALSVAAVAGTAFSLELVEAVRGVELVDEMDEACRAGLVAEEPGTPGRFRFAHALVRQVLLAELVTVKRLRLHQKIAELLEAAGDADDHLTELAHHWFECASTGNADKAVAYCRRAADEAVERLAYDEAADLYGMALQALEGVDDGGASRDELLLARCDALLSAGEVEGARRAIDDLEQAADSPHLRAWHAVFAAQLAVLAEPERLTHVVVSVGAAAAAMRDEDDVVGEAKAHYVHALALERLGQIGAAEQALDAALAAARKAGDRRLADAVLAGAPQAALWGPSPVTRASGRCLDVVRVLRITSGAPAVEAVALRCQAVLEALRGRMDAARRMIETARQTVEELGLTLRLLETEVMAGLIELLDGAPEAAEAHLRPAYEALRDRGLGGEAALAGALLGRALLAQGRDAEAEAVAEEASRRAGSDLKAAITWRGVLAEAAARRGDTVRALELARAAVELATATDALLLVADARRSLAAVLLLTGDVDAFRAEARRTAEVCDAKGATALAERARSALAQPRGDRRSATSVPSARVQAPAIRNAVLRMHEAFVEAWSARDWDRVMALCAPSWHIVDRRSLGSGELTPEESRASYEDVFKVNQVRAEVEEILATRGDRLVLVRRRLDIVEDGEHIGELRSLPIWRVDDQGRWDLIVDFDEDDVDAAFDELDRLYGEGEAASALVAWRGLLELDQAINAADPIPLRACLAPGFVGTLPSRAMERTPRGPDEFVEFLLGLTAVRPDVRTRYRHVLALDETRALVVATRGVADDFEFDGALVFSLDTEGRVRRQWGFTVEQLDDAWRQYHELGEPDVPVGERFPNAATRLAAAIDAAWAARDIAAWRALFTEDAALSNRRAIVDTGLDPVDIFEASVKLAIENKPEIFRRSRTLATRGERLALVRVELTGSWGGAGPSEIQYLALFEVDFQGRGTRGVFLDVKDLDAAYDELDRLFIEGEGARGGAYWERSLATAQALNAGDEDALVDLFAPDFRYVPHGPLRIRGDIDRAGFVATITALRELRPDAKPRVLHVLALDVRRSLTVFGIDDTTGETDFELIHVYVTEADEEGRAVRRDSYSLDQLDQAWECYHALGRAEVPIGEQFPNAATRLAAAIDAAWAARDGAAWRALLAEDAETSNRRSLESALDPVDFIAGWWKLALEHGAEIVRRSRPLATRGDRLALVKVELAGSWGEAGPSEVPFLALFEVNDTGLATRVIVFDVDDLEAAYDELDRLFIAGEGAAGGAYWERSSAIVRALNQGDEEAMVAHFSPQFRYVPHGPLRIWGDLDRAGFVAHTRGIFEVRPDAKIRVRHVLALDAGRSLTVGTNSDRADAGDFELPIVVVTQADAEGRPLRRDSYSLDQLDDAWERYQALGRADVPIGEQFPNAASRLAHAVDEPFAAGDLAAQAALFAADAVFVSRRRLIEAGLGTREAFLAVQNGVGDAQLVRRTTVLATRGERLALVGITHEGTWADAGETEVTYLAVFETNEEGLGIRTVFLDVEDLDLAYDELDRRYAALEELGATWTWMQDFEAAQNRRDFEHVRTLLAPGFEFLSHLPLGAGALGIDEFIEYNRSTTELRGEARYRVVHVLAVDHRRVLNVGTVSDVTGIDFQMQALVLKAFDTGGRVLREELFPVDQVDEAWARYHSLAPAEATTVGARFPNAVTRLADALCRAYNARDFEAFAELFAPEFRFVSNRLTTVDVGLGEYLETMQFDERRQLTWDLRPLATRGDRLALMHHRTGGSWDDAGDTVLENVVVTEVNTQGKGVRAEVFDVDDLDAAYDALDRWFIEGEGAAGRQLWERSLGFSRALGAGRVEEAMAALAPGFTFVDNRALGWGELDGPGLAAYFAALRDMRPEANPRSRHVLALEARRSLTVFGIDEATGDADFELIHVYVVEADEDGRAVRRDSFSLDQLDQAWARYHEIGSSNAAMRHHERFRDAWAARDLNGVLAELAPTWRLRGRRAYTAGDLSAEESFRSLRMIFRAPQSRWVLEEVVATRGDRLALARVRFEAAEGSDGAGPLEYRELMLWHVDDQGRRDLEVDFDEDDVDAAIEELDRLHAELDETSAGQRPIDAAGTRLVERTLAAAHAAIDAADWKALRDLCADDMTFEERRPPIESQGGADLFVETQKLTSAMGGRMSLEGREVSGKRLGTWAARWEGGAEGLLAVEVDHAGLLTALVIFSSDQWREAQRELHRRFRAGDGAPFAVATDAIQRWREAFHDRDADVVRMAMTPDAVIVDHRVAAAMPRIDGVDAYLEAVAHLWRLAPDVHVWGDWLALAPNGGAVQVRRIGELPDGGLLEDTFLLLAIVSGGRVERMEAFDDADLDGALGRFAELSAAPGRRYLGGGPAEARQAALEADTRATRAMFRFLVALAEGDQARETLAADVVFESRRRGVGFVAGADALLVGASTLGGVDGEREILATAGQRVAVEHHRWRGSVGDDAGTFETDLLMVIESDDDDRLCALVTFDISDRGDAMAEMHRRYFAGEGAAYNAVGRIVRESRDRFQAGDWHGLRQLYADDFAHANHEVGGLYAPTLGADAWVELMRTYTEATPDVDIETGTIIAITEQGTVGRTGISGHLGDGGGEFRHDYITVTMVRDDRYQRIEFFGADDLDRALARFEELVTAEVPANAATRMVDEVLEAWHAERDDAEPDL